jgi:uncharacterized membrane protein
MTSPKWSDERIEAIIGNLLRAGVLISAAIVFSGGLIFLGHNGKSLANYRVFQGEPDSLKSIPGIIRHAIDLQGRGLIQLGLLLLIATPLARVAFSVFGFAAQGDRLYLLFTLVVLLILLFSLLGSSAVT